MKRFLCTITALFMLMVSAQPVLAQDECASATNGLFDLNYIENCGLPGFKFLGGTLGSVVQATLPIVFAVAGMLLLLYLLYGGFHLMTSGGDPKGIQEAKGKITNAFIGFIIIFVAYWLVQIIARVFGLQPITEIFG